LNEPKASCYILNSKTCIEQTTNGVILHFWEEKKNILNVIIIQLSRFNFWRGHLLTPNFLFKPNSLNCEADEAFVSWSIHLHTYSCFYQNSSTYLQLSYQKFFVCIL